MTDKTVAGGAGDGTAGGEKPSDGTAADPNQNTPAQAGAEGDPTKGKDAAGDKPKEGAPEKYDDFKVPEGAQELDKAKLEEFLPVAKALNLTQEAAQKLIDFYAKTQADAINAMTTKWAETHAQWRKDAETDAEIGGANLQDSLKAVNAFKKAFGSPELDQLLEDTRIGDHPALLRAFVKVGKAVSEAGAHFGRGSSAATPEDAASTFYPSMKQ